MPVEDLVERLKGIFSRELGEHVAAVRQELGRVSADRAAAVAAGALDTLFREVHTIKGSAAAIGAEAIAATAASLERLLSGARKDPAVLTAERLAVISEATDAIESGGRRFSAEGADASPGLAGVLGKLEAAGRAGGRVILADDSATARTIKRGVLAKAGYDVAAAADGESAWRLLDEKGADLVVTDVQMPGLDGFGLLERIRGSDRFRELPVLLVSADDEPEDHDRAIERGASEYLRKTSHGPSELLAAVGRLLQKRRTAP